MQCHCSGHDAGMRSSMWAYAHRIAVCGHELNERRDHDASRPHAAPGDRTDVNSLCAYTRRRRIGADVRLQVISPG